MYRTEEAYETYLTQNYIYESFVSLICFCSPLPFFDQGFNRNFSFEQKKQDIHFHWYPSTCNYFNHVGGYQDFSGQ